MTACTPDALELSIRRQACWQDSEIDLRHNGSLIDSHEDVFDVSAKMGTNDATPEP